jgi:hypothetical protein
MTTDAKKKPIIYLTMCAVLAVAPLVRAQDGARTQVAAAIGAEEKPVAPAAPTNNQPTPAPEPTAEAPQSKPVEQPSEGGLSKAQIWLGVGVAAFLAAVAGGGGGGSSTSH